MVKVVVTGAKGFIGKHLCRALKERDDTELVEVTRTTPQAELMGACREAAAIFHLAGVNRSDKDEDFWQGNYALTVQIVDYLKHSKRHCEGETPFLYLASSTKTLRQRNETDSYSLSKLAAANYVQLNSVGTYCAQIGILPHVFGPGARPFYNSVISTWCHQMANRLPARIVQDNYSTRYEFIHVDHVVANALEAMDSALNAPDAFMEQQQKSDGALWYSPYDADVSGYLPLSELYSFLKQCAEVRSGGPMPSQELRWERDLYATFLSYIGDCEYMYAPKTVDDQRGRLVQVLGGDGLGQWYTVEFAPGAVRGNHYHKRKAEKFFVVHGCVDIELKGILEPWHFRKFALCDMSPRIVDVPPNYVHTLTNTTSRTATVLCWTQEPFDENDQDTYREKTDAI